MNQLLIMNLARTEPQLAEGVQYIHHLGRVSLAETFPSVVMQDYMLNKDDRNYETLCESEDG